jgi:hypothetical protein
MRHSFVSFAGIALPLSTIDQSGSIKNAGLALRSSLVYRNNGLL